MEVPEEMPERDTVLEVEWDTVKVPPPKPTPPPPPIELVPEEEWEGEMVAKEAVGEVEAEGVRRSGEPVVVPQALSVGALEVVRREEGVEDEEGTLVPVVVEDRVMVLAMVGEDVALGEGEEEDTKDRVGAEEEEAVIVTIIDPVMVMDEVEVAERKALPVPVTELLKDTVVVALGVEAAVAVEDPEEVPEGEAREDPVLIMVEEADGQEDTEAVELGVEVCVVQEVGDPVKVVVPEAVEDGSEVLVALAEKVIRELPVAVPVVL